MSARPGGSGSVPNGDGAPNRAAISARASSSMFASAAR
jgi:hypothetical protein